MAAFARWPNWGMRVFKITETTDKPSYRPRALPDMAGHGAALADLCVSEEWSANLDEGTLSIGHWASALHGLSTRECGLLGLTRAYEPSDRRHIISLFEQAAAAASSFCYSSTIALGEGRSQPVFCIAESTSFGAGAPLTLSGIFLFPRFKLDGGLAAGPLCRFA